MCECAALPATVADLDYWERNFRFEGRAAFPGFFNVPDGDSFEPALDHSTRAYRCTACGQRWHVECAPEEQPSPVFAMKLEPGQLLDPGTIRSQKEFLCILAHRGFAAEGCRWKGCQNLQLKGRLVCHLHVSFP
jgi:hypothetical protein